MSKRRRVPGGFTRGPKRPIDKGLNIVFKNTVGASQVATVLDPAAQGACTITGLRWQGNVIGDGETAGLDHVFSWAIVLVREGNSASTLDHTTDGGTLYQPEQDVLVFGIGNSQAVAGTSTVSPIQYTGSTKTMRKLRQGDRIHFIAIGTVTETVTLHFCIQMFCMS